MASSDALKVVQSCRISPPQGSVPSSLPVTFFDIPWLLSSPTQPLFFYHLPHFTQETVAALKHSLSLTLEHFFLLAGNLVVPPQPSKPHLSYAEGDSVPLVFAESNGNFPSLCCHEPRNVQLFRQLVPRLSEPVEGSNPKAYPLLAVQVTTFPGFGVCMGFSLRKVTADCRTFDNFLKTWASIFKCPQFVLLNQNIPCYNRALIQDPTRLAQVFMDQLGNLNSLHRANSCIMEGKVRASFVVGPKEMGNIKKWITTQSLKIFGSNRLYLSPYVVTCALVWVCWTKTHLGLTGSFPETLQHFGFNAGCINRLGYPVPDTYVGNCIGFGKATVRRDRLMGENGVLFAAKAIGDTIKELDREVLGKAENWIADWSELSGSEFNLVVTGSPKVGSYQLDFGWGRPEKIEEISIDETRGSASLLDCRDVVGGMEVGICLPKAKMERFASLLGESLKLTQIK